MFNRVLIVAASRPIRTGARPQIERWGTQTNVSGCSAFAAL